MSKIYEYFGIVIFFYSKNMNRFMFMRDMEDLRQRQNFYCWMENSRDKIKIGEAGKTIIRQRLRQLQNLSGNLFRSDC